MADLKVNGRLVSKYNPRECPVCKMLDEEIGEITNKEHHTSALKQGEKLLDHLVNFHRLPNSIAGMFATGYALGGFLKDHPTFDVSFEHTGIKLQKED